MRGCKFPYHYAIARDFLLAQMKLLHFLVRRMLYPDQYWVMFRLGLYNSKQIRSVLYQKKKVFKHTKSGLQMFDISSFRSTLPSCFLVHANMTKARTCSTSRSPSVASQFAPPTHQTCDAFFSGNLIVWCCGPSLIRVSWHLRDTVRHKCNRHEPS